MYSLVVMAAFATAPEMDGLFRRRNRGGDCCASAVHYAPVSSCCDAAVGPVAPVPGGPTTVTPMPGGPGAPVAPSGSKIETMPKKLPKAVTSPGTAPAASNIDIPADLRRAIDQSNKKDEIYQYLNNQDVPREERVNFLNQVRQQLLPGGAATPAPAPAPPPAPKKG